MFCSSATFRTHSTESILLWSFLRPRKYFYKIWLLKFERARMNWQLCLFPQSSLTMFWNDEVHTYSRVDLPNSFDTEFSSPSKAKASTVRNIKISNAYIYCLIYIYQGRVSHLAEVIQDTTAMNTNKYATECTNDDVSTTVLDYIQRLEVE